MKHSFLVAIIMIFSILIFGVIKYRKGKNYTLSQHIAQDKTLVLSFSLVVTVSVILSGLTMFMYIPGRIKVDILYYVLMIIILACLLILAWCPDTKGLSRRAHLISAWLMAYSMLPLLIYLYCLQSNFILLLSIIYMIFLQTKLKLSSENILIVQIEYILIFIANILILIYSIA